MDPDKAAKMFVQWQKWRSDFVPLGFIADSQVPDELEDRKIYLQGLSKGKYPVAIVKASKHFPSKDQLQFKSNFANFLLFVCSLSNCGLTNSIICKSYNNLVHKLMLYFAKFSLLF